MAIKVLVVDDHPVILQGLRGMLATLEDLEVVGEAGSGPEAIEKTEELKPDVLLMDVRLPELNGLEAMRRLRENDPDIKVVFITVSDSDLYLVEALRWGANGAAGAPDALPRTGRGGRLDGNAHAAEHLRQLRDESVHDPHEGAHRAQPARRRDVADDHSQRPEACGPLLRG